MMAPRHYAMPLIFFIDAGHLMPPRFSCHTIIYMATLRPMAIRASRHYAD